MLKLRVSLLMISLSCMTGAAWAQVTQSVPATQPTTLPASEVIATINGEAIGRQEYTNALIQLHGMRLFEQLLPRILVEQACKQAGIKITEDEIRALHQRRLEALGAQNPLIPANQRETALREVLARRGISMFEYQLQLNIEAGLMALAKGKYTPTDEEVKRTFDIEYGERFQLRDIVVGNFADAAEIRRLVEQDKKPIDDVIRERNLQANPLVLSEKSQNIPQQIRSVAFQLKEKQLSASVMMPDNTFHMLYLDRKIAARPDVKFESVKDKVRQDVIDAHEREMAGQILQNLRRSAKIEVYDPSLRAIVTELQRQAAAQQAAATQQAPAAAPAAPNK